MIDRPAREKLADALAQIISGDMDPEHFDDHVPHESDDPVIGEIVAEVYDDLILKARVLPRKRKPVDIDPYLLLAVERSIVFLRTDLEYDQDEVAKNWIAGVMALALVVAAGTMALGFWADRFSLGVREALQTAFNIAAVTFTIVLITCYVAGLIGPMILDMLLPSHRRRTAQEQTCWPFASPQQLDAVDTPVQ